MLPAQARKMPMIKVLHQGKIEKLSLERYVASVLAGEVHASWPLEALKAQAIASRTFALRRMMSRQEQTYHIQSSVMDQVYKKQITEIFVKAVRESAGVVLMANNDFAETSFHSTCGGATTDAKSVWGRAYPYLVSQSCGFCKTSPTYIWSFDLPLSDLKAKFGVEPTQVRIASRTRDGRAAIIELGGKQKKTLSGHDFRMALGPMKVKSTLIKDITILGSHVKINGQGFGHGVGLCQFGARGMALAGETSEKILHHYYPGTTLKKLY
jgi:stage II sporulation protein D